MSDETTKGRRPRRGGNPQLAELDPVAVATEACTAVLEHLQHYGIPLSPVADVRVMFALTTADDGPPKRIRADDLARGSTLGHDVQALTLYAQRGMPVWDWPDEGCAADCLLGVWSALCSSPASRELIDPVEHDEHEIAGALELVRAAALARVRLSQGAHLRVRDLAALSGVSEEGVRKLVQRGELVRAEDEGIEEAEARRWLVARDVPGVDPRTSIEQAAAELVARERRRRK